METILSELRPDSCDQTLDDDSDDGDMNTYTEPHISISEACDLLFKLKTYAKQIGNFDLMSHLSTTDDELCSISIKKENKFKSQIFSKKELYSAINHLFCNTG